jgi:predicted SprT family Zn-dependent metalloprotease
MKTPTTVAYTELDSAYTHFNRTLFRGDLPPCLITLQRKSHRVLGFFAPERFQRRDGAITDEIAMNPAHFANRDMIEVLSTLAHEMVHLRQKHFGKPGRRGYHNKEWGRMMKEVGLYPSNTGQPGGKETGEQMTHYVMEDGPFDQACRDLLAAGFRITWHEKGAAATPEGGEGGNPSGAPAPRKNRTNRYKYTCPRCGLNAWGKPNIKLMCGQCQIHLVRRV